jgi:glycosyltransferase involved in cell wall biosynthesis
MSVTDSTLSSTTILSGARWNGRNGKRRETSITVVMPALNEAANLPHVLPLIPSFVDEVVLVDGHSIDSTIAVARELRPDVRVVIQDRHGKGNALACGFAAASGDIIVMLDADGSTDPNEIPRFVGALLEGSDFAKGSRYVAGGASSDITKLRAVGNKVLAAAVNLLFRTRYTDLCYGYNAFWRHCLPYMNVTCDGFEVETQIHVRIARAGLAVTEVASVEHPRLHGESKLNALRDGLRVLRTILRERARQDSARRLTDAWRPAFRELRPAIGEGAVMLAVSQGVEGTSRQDGRAQAHGGRADFSPTVSAAGQAAGQ